MQIQDIYVKTYYRLIGRTVMLKPIRLVVRTLANYHLKYAFKMNRKRNRCTSDKSDVIVSVTSFPARIKNLWVVIETLLRQTTKPQKIMIWLSREQFSEESIPQSLWKLQPRGVEIRLVDGDIRSHKKYYYVFKEHPDDLILLADDDIIYPSDLIESLLKEREKSKGDKVVTFKYGYKIKYKEDGTLSPYNNWGHFYDSATECNMFFGSGGGTLLRPSDLYADITNIDLALSLCPQADDIWLNAMAKLGNCEYIKDKDGPILSVQNRDGEALFMTNVRKNRNDTQLKKIIEYYLNHSNINPFQKCN